MIIGGLIGTLTAVGSVGFTKLIHLAHGLCYGGDGSLYEQGKNVMLIVLPAAGALCVGLITYFFAREAKGHGVPEVMDAIARRDCRIRPRVALAKAVASALTIGSGGSAGTEGPIIQIGAAVGSALGQFLQVVRHNMQVLVGCGAAAGIAAIFHAPIAGVLFSLEIFLRELNFRTFSPVLIASVLSSVVTSALLGSDEAIFPILNPAGYSFQWFELGNYVLLGLLCAAAAVLFIKLLYAFEDFFDWLKIHHIAKPILGAVALGLVGILSINLFSDTAAGEPAIFGNGYPLIGLCIGSEPLEGATSTIELSIGILLVMFLLKTLATCLTLGSGGSGGIFAPSLFLGASLGYAFGLAVGGLGVFGDISPATYALVGMASVVAATTHAPMTAIIILLEMTHNYKVILPVMFSATIAVGIAQLLCRDSIYTLKLRRRGVMFETRANTAILRRLDVGMVMIPSCAVVHDDTPLQEIIRQAVGMELADFIVTNHEGHYCGLLVAADLRAALLEPEAVPLLVAGELTRTKVPTVNVDETLDKVLDKFSRLDVNSMAVHSRDDENKYIGMITRASLMRRYQRELELAG